jgi:hypothetical protein
MVKKLKRLKEGTVTLTRFTYKIRQFAVGGYSVFNHLADTVQPEQRLYFANVTVPAAVHRSKK